MMMTFAIYSIGENNINKYLEIENKWIHFKRAVQLLYRPSTDTLQWPQATDTSQWLPATDTSQWLPATDRSQWLPATDTSQCSDCQLLTSRIYEDWHILLLNYYYLLYIVSPLTLNQQIIACTCSKLSPLIPNKFPCLFPILNTIICLKINPISYLSNTLS